MYFNFSFFWSFPTYEGFLNQKLNSVSFAYHLCPNSLPDSVRIFPYSISGYRTNIFSVFLFCSFLPATSSSETLAVCCFPSFSYVQIISTFSHLSSAQYLSPCFIIFFISLFVFRSSLDVLADPFSIDPFSLPMVSFHLLF